MVQPQSLASIVQAHPFFADLSPDFLEVVACCAANERHPPGAFLLREGGPANKFFLIRDGRVAVEIAAPSRQPIILETLEQGDILGWSWLVPPHRATFDARTQTDVRVLSFDGACLLRKMEAEPRLGYEVLRRFVPVMADRLSACRLQALDLYGGAP